MMHIKKLNEGIDIYKALASDLRIRLLELLTEEDDINMNELANKLGITSGALTNHVRTLEKAGLIKIATEHDGHGNQKICKINVDKIIIDITESEDKDEINIYGAEISVGHYSDYNISPTCGLATEKNLIGITDDPRYFSHSQRMEAKILWFKKGYVEYIIPNLLPEDAKIDKITLSMEIGSEASNIDKDQSSDIIFALNNTEIGKWTTPNDSGNLQGILSPDWWFPGWNQHGLLKMIDINKKGTYIDGLKISDVTIDDFKLNYESPIRFRLAATDETDNIGGLTIFGSGFGNYNQDIKVRISYS